MALLLFKLISLTGTLGRVRYHYSGNLLRHEYIVGILVAHKVPIFVYWKAYQFLSYLMINKRCLCLLWLFGCARRHYFSFRLTSQKYFLVCVFGHRTSVYGELWYFGIYRTWNSKLRNTFEVSWDSLIVNFYHSVGITEMEDLWKMNKFR